MPDPICLKCISERILDHSETCPDYDANTRPEERIIKIARAMLGKRWREELGHPQGKEG